MTVHFLMTSRMSLNQHKTIENNVIVASLKKTDKLNSRFASFDIKFTKRMLNLSASLAMSTSVLKALPGKLDIKRHSPSIFYL